MSAGGARALLRLRFGLSLHVSRRACLLSGLGPMTLNYAIDTALVAVVTGRT